MNRKIAGFGLIMAIALLGAGMIFIQQTNKKIVSESKTIIKKNKSTMKTENLTKEAFIEKVFDFENNKEWKYKGELPCLIDFYADWCGPCKAVAPILEELAVEYAGQIKIYKIDTEAEQELAGAFGIRSIPSLLFCPAEGQPQMAMGALPKASLKKAIDEILLNKVQIEK
ncbi:MAG: thioredoxin [Cyclobacteriaceae bacterium]